MSTKLFPKNIPQDSILGLNFSGMHDSAIALVSPEGKPLYAVSLERISRVKQDGRYPDKLLEGLPWERIAKVALSVEREYIASTDQSSTFNLNPLASLDEADRSHSDIFYQLLDTIPVKKVFIPHHLCHAASAFWLSGFSNATCLVYDGGMSNEEWFGGVYNASIQDGIVAIDQFSARSYSNVAHLYTAVTALLGFTPLKHEGKITGLAAYGIPSASCRTLFEQWLHQPELLAGIVSWEDMYSQSTPPRLRPSYAKIQSLKSSIAKYTREDIAATVQKIAEEHITGILGEIIQQGAASDNLCLSGGLFANVKINQRASELEFKNTFVSPPMSDDGTALGAALQAASENPEFSPKPAHSMYLGPNFSDDVTVDIISKKKIKFQTPDDSAKEVAKLLATGSIVAICQGASEFGPRSLGNRSILASADDPEINQLLNNRLNRTEFMPFAPICLAEDADRLFSNTDRVKHSAEFMTVTVNCTDEMKTLCPAVVHCDGTARPQLVTPKSNPFIYKLLSHYKALSGKPALVNTSFNVHEEPIVCSPEDALKGFFESGLDALFIEGQLIKRCENREIETEYLRRLIKHNNSISAETKKRDRTLTAELEIAKANNASLTSELSAKSEALTTQEAQSHWLQNEWDAIKTHNEELATELSVAKANNENLATELSVAKANNENLATELGAAEILAQQSINSLQTVYNSRSWRISAPLRAIGRLVKAMRPNPARN